MNNTIDNPVIRVYERWEESMKAVLEDNQISIDESGQIASYPFAHLSLLGNPAQDINLEGDEDSTIVSFQVQVYTYGNMALSKAYGYDAVSHQAMRDMGFTRNYGPGVIKSDDGVVMTTSRYRMKYTGRLLGE